MPITLATRKFREPTVKQTVAQTLNWTKFQAMGSYDNMSTVAIRVGKLQINFPTDPEHRRRLTVIMHQAEYCAIQLRMLSQAIEYYYETESKEPLS